MGSSAIWEAALLPIDKVVVTFLLSGRYLLPIEMARLFTEFPTLCNETLKAYIGRGMRNDSSESSYYIGINVILSPWDNLKLVILTHSLQVSLYFR